MGLTNPEDPRNFPGHDPRTGEKLGTTEPTPPYLEGSEKESDPFSAQEAPGVSLIVQMRIYDVLMGIFRKMDPQAARELLELHYNGAIMGPTPNFTGAFLTDNLNENDEI